MDENITQDEALQRRCITLHAFGDNADAIEMDALDEARRAFGPDVALEVVRNYVMSLVEPGSALAARAGGKRYRAQVLVRERA